MTEAELKKIIAEAKAAAKVAATKFFHDKLNGEDKFSCGFAWTSIYSYGDKVIKGNTKIGRLFKACGVSQNHNRQFMIWNPAEFPVQNIDTLEAGAAAAAEVFKRYGFEASMGSRLD